MAVASFQALYDGVCAVFGLEAPQLQPDALGITGFTLRVQEVDVSVVQAPDGSAPAAFVLVEFGTPPPGRELETWHALLNANFLMLGANAPNFSRNPVSGEVVLQYACPLQDATPEGLGQSIERIADVAARWRQDYFLADDSPPLPAPDAHAPTPFFV